MDSKKKQNLEATYERIIHVGLCIVPYEDLSDLTAPEMMLFGTTKDERVFSFSELDAMFKSQYEQMVGFVPSLDRKRLFTRFSNDGNNASITEEVTLTISSPEDVNTIFIRCSCVMEYIDNQWKLTHWHASTPVETENDHWHQEEWKREKEKLQKLVDKQTADLIGKNRDLEIETALERVRSRSMAMQKSEELAEVVRQIKEEMMELGIDVNNTQIGTDFTSDPHDGFNDWVSVEGQRYLEKFHIPFIDHPLTEKYYETLENDLGYFTVKYSKSEKNAYFKLLFEYSDFKYIPEERKNFILNTPGWVICGVILKNSSMQFARYNLKKFNQAEIDVFKRFGKVFEQAYTRFLDLQKAEVQAREAEIELALERVRARTMAMRSSDELAAASSLLFQQTEALGVHTYSSGFTIWDEKKGDLVSWMCNADGSMNPPFRMPIEEEGWHQQQYESWKKQEDFIIKDLTGAEMKSYFRYLRSFPLLDEAFKISKAAGHPMPERQVHHVANFSHGNLLFITLGTIPEAHEIFKRFAKVFEQTYTRFLDLQKAEDQAREANIQLALERVRAKSMAMKTQSDLLDIIELFGEQLNAVGIRFDNVTFIEGPITKKRDWDLWSYAPEAENTTDKILIPYIETPYFTKTAKAVKEYQKTGQPIQVKTFTKKEKNEFLDHYWKHAPAVSDEFVNYVNATPGSMIVDALLEVITVSMVKWNAEPYSDEELAIFERFAKEFKQTYIRFLDIKKAEAQAREAQIEAALERVRAKAMAMHNTSDLVNANSVVFDELNALGISPLRSGIGLVDAETRIGLMYATVSSDHGNNLLLIGEISLTNHHILESIYENVISKQFYHIELNGKELTEYYDILLESYGNLPKPKFSIKETQHGYFLPFEHGTFYAWTQEPFNDESLRTIQRFVSVINLTYNRYFDLKKAEEQAREAQIEVAVERVRAKALAMHKSTEILQVAVALKEQMEGLNLSGITAATIYLEHDESKIRVWDITELKESEKGPQLSSDFTFRLEDTDPGLWVRRVWNAREKYSVIEMSGDDFIKCEEWIREFDETAADNYREFIRAAKVEHTWHPTVQLEKGKLNLDFIVPPPPEMDFILPKMGAAFDLAYRRFLDLQKAEAQTREAQIEASLERVRAKAMSMQNSDELDEVLSVLCEQFDVLGILPMSTHMTVFNFDNNTFTFRETGKYGDRSFGEQTVALDAMDTWKDTVDKWKADKATSVNKLHFPKETLPEVWEVFQESFASMSEESRITPDDYPHGIYHTAGKHPFGYIGMNQVRPATEEEEQIVIKFANEFGRAYQRFLDLKKAESQAREATIENALEKVRSRSMAMQSSDELADVGLVLFQQIEQAIGFKPESSWITFINSDKNTMEIWVTHDDKFVKPKVVSAQEHKNFKQEIAAWKSGEASIQITLPKEDFMQAVKKSFGMEVSDKKEYLDFHVLNVRHKYGFLGIGAWNLVSDENIKIYQRFAKVFEQTYTRFLDLQKAEAQAREATIENALEKVRSHSLAMHKSDELNEVVQVLFEKMTELQVPSTAVAIQTFTEGSKDMQVFVCGDVGTGIVINHYIMPYFDHPITNDYLEAHEKKLDFYVGNYSKKEKNSFYDVVLKLPELKDLPTEVRTMIRESGIYEVTMVPAEKSLLAVNDFHENPLSESQISILKRFSKVFDQAYTRFLDLQKAEKQTAEAVKQASLDRVRGEIASMRSVDDLENIIPLLWNELNTLGVPFIRCGVFIIHEVEEQVEVYLSKPDGTSLAVMHLPFASNKLATQTVESWRNKEVFTQRWSQQDFLDFGKGLIEQEQISDLKSYQGAEEAPESLYLHFIPFNQGMLYVGSTLSLKEEEIHLSESLAKAFSIAYARYEDFVKLEKAKASIEETLAELKATQSQLVQQEKLASLGQLTAGIAHEIKNPLNFVNNFSELSVELIEETREELSSLSNKLSAEDREKLEDALEILNDIEANLKTIHKHGTRADSIVKSMLQHSRGSSGAMAPTNLNAMIKEYSNLAFHGMRAGKNPINVTIQHELDSSIKKIPLIEEDFTRVLLNLFNNAFDAMRETEALRAPLLTVRSQKINQHISIEIEDNGPGIPDEIKDKIMQPFFTTKKGTEGTGLGLSITNDIIKAHGGELSIKSTSGSGSAFVITLRP